MEKIIKTYIVCSLLFLGACVSSEYERLEKRELKKGIRSDSLFLGFSFKTTSKEFYARCWELNKKKILTEGYGNASVQYKMPGLKFPATFYFYPKFTNDRISEMNGELQYNDWAPWNSSHHCDSLQEDFMVRLKSWYGVDFIKVESKTKGIAYVAVDGNKRITLFCKSDMSLRIIWKDLSPPEPAK